jgi:hypothetical protein
LRRRGHGKQHSKQSGCDPISHEWDEGGVRRA